MGETTMKITVLGAMLIVAAVVAVVLLVRALNQQKGPGPEEGQSL
jgi:archaellin